MNIWFTLLYQPLVNVLMFMYQALWSNLGIAIIATTVLVRLLLLPLTAPGMQSAAKMQTLKPELDKLKKKFGNDKQGLAQAQLELYRAHKINPFGSLLPTIIQLLLLFAMFQAFTTVLTPAQGVGEINKILYPFIQLPEHTTLDTRFLYLDVTKPDMLNLPQPLTLGPIIVSQLPGIFLLAAVVVQYLSSKFMLGQTTKKQSISKSDPKTKSGDQDDMMVSMQKQMMIIGPLMTLIIGIRFPSGMVLYWFVISLTMIFQQMYMQRKQATALANIQK